MVVILYANRMKTQKLMPTQMNETDSYCLLLSDAHGI